MVESWAIVTAPLGNPVLTLLSGTAAESSSSIWSVGSGSGRAFASHWDGSAWTDAPILQLGAATLFEGVAAIGVDAWAVGWFASPGRDQTFAVRYRGN
jgi:hypothetical protein